jgi:endonuclease G, mitochondrial
MEIHCKHFFKGYPLGTPISNDLIIRDIYALSNNDQTKMADWVVYRLTPQELEGDLEVEREWRTDPWLDDSETLEAKPSNKDDYRNVGDIGMDRGHQAPLADFKGSVYASQANLLSNITPQSGDLNKGIWKTLEDKVREIVRKGKWVYVMTGPLFEKRMAQLPNADERHRVPSGYWKIIVVPDENEGESFKVAAFIFEQNTPRNKSLIQMLTTVNEIERRSKLNFFWEIPDKREEDIENTIFKAWAEELFGSN